VIDSDHQCVSSIFVVKVILSISTDLLHV